MLLFISVFFLLFLYLSTHSLSLFCSVFSLYGIHLICISFVFLILLVRTVVDSPFSLWFSLVAAIVVCIWLSNIWCWVKFGGVLHSSYSILVDLVTWNEHHWNLCHFWHMVLCATWILTVLTFVLHLFFECDSRYFFFIEIVNDCFITCFDLYRRCFSFNQSCTGAISINSYQQFFSLAQKHCISYTNHVVFPLFFNIEFVENQIHKSIECIVFFSFCWDDASVRIFVIVHIQLCEPKQIK